MIGYKNKNSGSSAFTLIEIMIAIAIVGIMSAVVMGSATLSRSKARDTRRVGDLKEIQLGLAVYYDVNRSYPTDLNSLITDKYLPSVPVDPLGASYEYAKISNSSYCLGATLEDITSSPGDGVSCNTGGTANYKVQQPLN